MHSSVLDFDFAWAPLAAIIVQVSRVHLSVLSVDQHDTQVEPGSEVVPVGNANHGNTFIYFVLY